MGKVIDINQRVPAHVPQLLRALPAWLIWRKEQFAGEARPRKVPYYVNDTRRHGTQGGPHDRAMLATFEEARAAAIKYGFDGVGLAMLPDWGITALDFDKCIDANGKLNGELVPIAGMTYSEVSPSGTGLRAFVLGNLGNRKDIAAPGRFGVEVFSSTGFVTITGDVTDFCDIVGNNDKICEPSPELLDLLETRFGTSSGAVFDPDDFMAGREPRLGLTVEQIEELLSALDPDMPRDPWLRVGLGVHHECEGDDTGFDIWDEWSSEGDTYPGTEALRYQWDSFKGPTPGRRQVTMASVIKMAKNAGYIASSHTNTTPAGVIASSPSAETISASPFIWRNPATIPPRPWLFGRWLLKGTVACVVAPGGVGKSTFMSALAISCASGKDLLGKQVWGGPKRVWLWNLEDDLDELSRTIQATCLLHGIKAKDIGSHLFVDSAMEGPVLCTATESRDGIELRAAVFEAIIKEIKSRGIDVLIIDPFVSSHAVEENSNSKIDKIVKEWARAAQAAGCAVVLVHHTSKAGAGEVNTNSARGASALTSAARSVLTLNRMSQDTANKFGIPEERRRRYIAIIDDKHNRAPAETDTWIELVAVDLGNSDSVAACAPWTPPTHASELDLKAVAAVQKLLDQGAYRTDAQANDWVGKAIASVVGLDLANTTDCIRIKAIQKDWTSRRFLMNEMRKGPKGRPASYSIAGVRPVLEQDQPSAPHLTPPSIQGVEEVG